MEVSKAYDILIRSGALNVDMGTDPFRIYVIPYTENMDESKACRVHIAFELQEDKRIDESYIIVEDNIDTIKEVIKDTKHYAKYGLDETDAEDIANDGLRFATFLGSRYEYAEYKEASGKGVNYRIYEVL